MKEKATPRSCDLCGEWLRSENVIGTDSPDRDVTNKAPALGEDKPRLYVVTVNYNSQTCLRRLVESLEPVGFVEKLVVVNHSPNDRLEGLTAGFPIHIVHQANRGYGAGLNRGLEELGDAEGLILLCNPDIVVLNHERIEDVWHYMNGHPNVGLVVPALVDAKCAPIFSSRKFYSLKSLLLARLARVHDPASKAFGYHHYTHHHQQGPLEVDWASGAAMFIRWPGTNVRPIFDERFFLYFEDVDLCARMWQANRQVVYFPGLTLQHLQSLLSHKKTSYFLVHIASLLKFIFKYKGLPQRAALQGSGNA